ncbi:MULTISPECIES: YqzE family protein [Geobacillus]|uniref:YqzE family protein n=1 Tax=Geobacillus TaxID=129337 RepID=UPI0009C03821|nr:MULTISPECIES: YqzE family protein [Geobacillus]OQP05780.1 YqzE family protein [Geobacillus sp. 46C-IIa]QIZ68349.1 YqzE family protein [Geobacillus subterraneus]QNU28864.1 YqzE family protein [Geobacillus sp. 46C-IIa]WPZ17373.1 YqzE family protein [Geobacillus subterraneus]
MAVNDYVKFVTQQFVAYMDMPKEERTRRRSERKQEQPPLSYRLFGLMPLSLRLLLRRRP